MMVADTVGDGALRADRWGGVKRLNYLQTFFLMCSTQSRVNPAPLKQNSQHQPDSLDNPG